MGNNVSDNVTSTAAIQSASDILTSSLNAAFTAGESKKQRKFTREMFQKQRKAAQETYAQVRADNLADYERQRKDYISDLLNADIRSVASRKNAGLSVAFGDGYSPAQPLAQDIRTSDFQVPQQGSASVANVMPFNNPLSAQNLLTSAQADLMRAQADKTRAETKGQLTTNEILKIDFTQKKETLETNIAQASANLQNTLAEIDVKKETKEQISSNITKINAEVKSITFDVDKLKPAQYELLKKQQEEISAKIRNLDSLTDINEIEKEIKVIQKHFNEFGIGIGSGLFDSVLGLLSSGRGTKLFGELKSMVSDMFNGLVTIDFEGAFKSVGKGLGSATKGIFKGAVGLVDELSNQLGVGEDVATKFVDWIQKKLSGNGK